MIMYLMTIKLDLIYLKQTKILYLIYGIFFLLGVEILFLICYNFKCDGPIAKW